VKWAAVLVVLAGCRLDFDELRDAPGDTAIDAAPPLVSRGVVARYFLDDSDGAMVTTATDAIDPPTNLSIIFDAGDPDWVVTPAGKALSFDTLGANGGGCAPVAGKVIDAFDGSTEATLEAVVDYRTGIATGSRIAHIGRLDSWTLSIGYSSETAPPRLWFAVETTDVTALDEYRRFDIDLSTRGRCVITLVYDANAATAVDRARMYIDGVRLAVHGPSTNDTYAPGEAIVIAADAHICVGNRRIGGRAPIGSIAYAAFYNVALESDETVRNAQRLLAWDDH
jgi:hypothetical protein